MALDVRYPLCALLALLVGSRAPRAGEAATVSRSDIVAVEARAPLADSDVPGLTDGAELMERLRGIQQIMSAGVPDVARQELQALIARIDTLRTGSMDGLPAYYRVAGELWLPVKADRVRVRLDAPDILPRPPRRGESASDDLIADARVIDWLPLDDTRARVDEVMRQVDGGPDARARARESLAAVLSGVTETTRFTDAASLDAYDAVEAALAAGDNWQPAVRDGLRRAAERLSAQDGTDRLASQLQTVADALTPETEPLLGVAQALRARIEAGAGVSAGQGAAPSKPGAVAGARTDRGGASAPRGGP